MYSPLESYPWINIALQHQFANFYFNSSVTFTLIALYQFGQIFRKNSFHKLLTLITSFAYLFRAGNIILFWLHPFEIYSTSINNIICSIESILMLSAIPLIVLQPSQKLLKEKTLKEDFHIVFEYTRNNPLITHCIIIWNVLMYLLLSLEQLYFRKLFVHLNQLYLVCSYWVAAYCFGRISRKLYSIGSSINFDGPVACLIMMGGVNLALMLFKQTLYEYIPAIHGSLYAFEALVLFGITKSAIPKGTELVKSDIEAKI